MRVSFSILVLSIAMSLPASAQVPITLEVLSQTSDSTIIAVNLGQRGSKLVEPITSFQFRVDVDSPQVVFQGLITDWTLSGRSGWTARANPENGKTGGFSSSLDAIDTGGVLTLLHFKLMVTGESVCTDPEIELSIFRLNSGQPEHSPASPSVQIPLCPVSDVDSGSNR